MAHSSYANMLKLLASHDREAHEDKESSAERGSSSKRERPALEEQAESDDGDSESLSDDGQPSAAAPVPAAKPPKKKGTGKRAVIQRVSDAPAPAVPRSSRSTRNSNVNDPPQLAAPTAISAIGSPPVANSSDSPVAAPAAAPGDAAIVPSGSGDPPLLSPAPGGGAPPPTPSSMPPQSPMVFPGYEWFTNITSMKSAALKKTAASLGLPSDGNVDELRASLLQLQGEAVVRFVSREEPVEIVSLGAHFTSPAAPSSTA